MDSIGNKILELRKQKGLTQEELSDLSQINLRTLQRIEKGKSQPRGNTLKNLCFALEINLEDILNHGKKSDMIFLRMFHFSVLSFTVIPFGNIILPLILWVAKRDKIADLNEQGIALLNFQILWTLIFNFFFFYSVFIKLGNGSHGNMMMYAAGVLYLVNIVYPIFVGIRVAGRPERNFYFMRPRSKNQLELFTFFIL